MKPAPRAPSSINGGRRPTMGGVPSSIQRVHLTEQFYSLHFLVSFFRCINPTGKHRKEGKALETGSSNLDTLALFSLADCLLFF